MSKYEDKILNALRYIQDNLEYSIVWNDVCKKCGISEYHFHRIFSTYMGESPGSFIKRKRMEKAAVYLSCRGKEMSIVDISLLCGYSSQANFSKAFKLYFGVTAGDVIKGEQPKKSKIGKIKSKYGKDFNVKDLYPNPELIKASKDYFKEVLMKVEMIDMTERTVMYMESKNGYVKESIHATWDSLIEQAICLPIKKEKFEMFGIGHDNPQITPEEKCRYDACILLEDGVTVGSSIKSKALPSGKYACFYFKGESSDLIQFYLSIYKDWFPKSGFEPGDFPLIEKYLTVSKESSSIELEAQFLVR